VIFQDGGRRHLGFSKTHYFNDLFPVGGGAICIIVPNFIKIGQTVAEIWRFNGFYRAMLCIRGTSHGSVSVRPSVCPSQVGVLVKRLNVESHKQHHTIAKGL